MMKRYLLIAFCFRALLAGAQTGTSFHSLEEVFVYADSHSSSFRNASQQTLLARYETIAARLSMFNLKGDAVVSSVDNTRLPVSFLPAEIFGGPAGTFKQITLGQKYASTAAITPQIDILSPFAAAKVKMAKANEKLVQVNNLITKRDLYQSIAGAYYNILSFQWQIVVTNKTLINADSITLIFKNKLKEGIARSQDLNNAEANQLLLQDKLQQLEVQLLQQYNSLKILCDMDPVSNISITADKNTAAVFDASLAATDNLLQRQSRLQQEYQQETLGADRKWFYPTLTTYGNLSWQQYGNDKLYNNSQWFPTNYLGLRLTVPLIPDATKIAAVKYDRINVGIASNNAQHAALQDSINNRQAELDYLKSFKSYQLAAKVAALKEDSYRKNMAIYQEGILSAADLFASFNDWLNSSLNEQVQLANSEYTKAKILITHSVK